MPKLQERALDWVDHAPVRAVARRTLTASPEEVFAALADHEGWPRWFRGMRSAVGQGTGVGSTRRVQVGALKAEERFVAWEPGVRYAFLITRTNLPGPVAFLEDFRLVPADGGGTEVTYVGALELPRLLAPLGGPTATALGKGVERALEALDALLAGRR